MTLTREYIDRLNYEINVIESMGYLDYFLIVADYVNEAKKRGYPIGPGRGSAAGALVSYCLGITDVDPLKYNLFFERFLNPERISMPDIDVDISDINRNDIIEYIANRFGNKRMSYIVTFSTIGAKQAIRDVGRIFSINQLDINSFASACKGSDMSLDENRKAYPEFDKLCRDSYFGEIYNLAKMIEGYIRQSSIHAAGIILNDEELEKIIPTSKTLDNKLICQYESIYIEEQGFLKMDILGLRNLTIIDNVVKRIRNRGIQFNLSNIPFDDKKTFLTLNAGLTKGIFQLESSGITQALKEVKISSFDDIVALLALYRPGPMQFIKTYAETKNRGLPIKKISPEIDYILAPTYGVIIYQEQIMQIVQIVASFSLGEADLFRRAISKKDESKMSGLKDRFISGALKNKYPKEVALKIYDMIYSFANYGFNKSHSVAYAIISYQMAYLKANYPAEFYAALLDSQSLNDASFVKYLNEFSLSDIKLCIPDINQSEKHYKVRYNKIILPFTAIKGLPIDVINAILNERKVNGPFKDYLQFFKRLVNYDIDVKHIKTLIKAGALDSFNYNRSSLLMNANVFYSYAQNSNSQFSLLSEEDEKRIQPIFKKIPEDESTKIDDEVETIGILLSSSLFSKYEKAISKYKPVRILEINGSSRNMNVIAIISDFKVIVTKGKKSMGILTCFDGNATMQAILFNEEYNKYKFILEEKKAYIITGYMKRDEIRGDAFIVNSLQKLEEDK